MGERVGREDAMLGSVRVEAEAGDAFGAALEAGWLAGGEPGQVHVVMERDDGFVESHDVSVYLQDPDDLDEFDRWCLDRVRGPVLDVGCGAGRHALAAQERGHEVLGIDPSPGAVRVARERGVDAVEASVPALPGGVTGFATILLLGNNVGLLGRPESAPLVLAALASVAAPGALLLGTNGDPRGGSAPEHVRYHEANAARGRMAGQLRLRSRYRALADDWFDYLLLSLDELAGLVVGSAWEITDHLEVEGRYAVQLLLRG